ncbi:mitochondrial protein Pet127-domain-containing protein [Amylocystis lapponica]|nr:mitochondrial protein Pet127-domain-containing protein [Amylocystis lapponica]
MYDLEAQARSQNETRIDAHPLYWRVRPAHSCPGPPTPTLSVQTSPDLLLLLPGPMLGSCHVSARILARLAPRTAHPGRLQLASNGFFTSSLFLSESNATEPYHPTQDPPPSNDTSSDPRHVEDPAATGSLAELRAAGADTISPPVTIEASDNQMAGGAEGGVSDDGLPIVSDAATLHHSSNGEATTTVTDVASAAQDATNRSRSNSDSLLQTLQEMTQKLGTPHEQPQASEEFRDWMSAFRSDVRPGAPHLEDESHRVQHSRADAGPSNGESHTKASEHRSAQRQESGQTFGPPRPFQETSETHRSREHPEPTPRLRLPWYKRRVDGILSPDDGFVVQDATPKSERPPIAKLTHGLERVLHNPGVHWVEDPRSGHHNFSSWVGSVPKVDDFAFDRVSGFVTSSHDEDLLTLAKQEGCMFAGSTSSLTGMLSQIYFLLSGELSVDTSVLSSAFVTQPKAFTPGQRMPVSVTIKYHNGVYSADSGAPHISKRESVLSYLGTMLEKYFTLPKPEFERLLKTSTDPDNSRVNQKEPYSYSKVGKFMMRAQLDCHATMLPGSGVFDIKTRAALPIRMNVYNFENHTSYEINKLTGLKNSFEKEYYDLIRSAFLKYSFQARIGNMDGVMVAYHNTAKVFGFQYIPLEEMYERLYGHAKAGPRVFEKCVGLLEAIFSEIVTYFPERTVHCTWATKEFGRVMHVWIEPETWADGEPKPLVQLNIKITNFLHKAPSNARKAVMSWDEPWSVHYSITKSPLPQDKIRAGQQNAHRRQLRVVKFGSNVNDILEHGDNVDPALLEKAEESQESLPVPEVKLFTTKLSPSPSDLPLEAAQRSANDEQGAEHTSQESESPHDAAPAEPQEPGSSDGSEEPRSTIVSAVSQDPGVAETVEAGLGSPDNDESTNRAEDDSTSSIGSDLAPDENSQSHEDAPHSPSVESSVSEPASPEPVETDAVAQPTSPQQ